MKKFIYISILASALILGGCKKDNPAPQEPQEPQEPVYEALALNVEMDSQWALCDVQIKANKAIKEWKAEVVSPSLLMLPNDGPVISDDGVLTLPVFRIFDFARKNPITDADIRVTANSEDGESVQCTVTSKAWMPLLVSQSGESINEDDLVYGSVFKVRVQYASESNSCLPANIFKEFVEFLYSDKAYKLIEYKEDYVKFEVLTGADDYTFKVGNDFYAWSLITEPANLPFK